MLACCHTIEILNSKVTVLEENQFNLESREKVIIVDSVQAQLEVKDDMIVVYF